MEENPKRRWFRFSLRTLLVAVTVFCIWLGSQWRIVQERQALRKTIEANPRYLLLASGKVSFTRDALGDERVVTIRLIEPPLEELERIKHAFPEAEVTTHALPRN